MASQTYSVLLASTNGHYVDFTISSTVNASTNTSTVNWSASYRVAGSGRYYSYNTGNKLIVQLNNTPYVDTANVCAIQLSGVGSKTIALGSFTYTHNSNGTGSFPVYVYFDQTQRTGNDGTISQTFYCDSIEKYALIYNGNGGLYNGSSIWSDPVAYDGEYYIYSNDNFFVRSGYTFTGWNLSADGTGDDWTQYIGTTWNWNYTYNVTLYAQWRANNHNIIYDTNGGTEESWNQVKTAGQTTTITSKIPTRQGYRFKYWLAPTYGVDFYPGDTYSYDSGNDVTLYAQWAKEYTLSYDSNGGVGESYEQKVIIGESILIDDNTFGHETDKFVGWCLRRNDNTWYTTSKTWSTEEELSENGYSKMLYLPGNSLTIDDSWMISDESVDTYFTLCAEWAVGNSVIFYSNNNTGKTMNILSYEGENFIFPSEVPSLNNHTFIYWTTGSDGTGKIYYPNDVVFIDSDNLPSFIETGLYAQYVNHGIYIYSDGTIEATGFMVDDSYQGVDSNGIIHMPQFIQHSDSNVQMGTSGLYTFTFKNKQKHDSLT